MGRHITRHQKDLLTLAKDAGLTDETAAQWGRTTDRTVRYAMANLKIYGSVSKPRIRNGPPPLLDDVVRPILLDYLLSKPATTLFEIAIFLFDEFKITPALSTISKAIRDAGWSRKVLLKIACQRSQDHRNQFISRMCQYQEHQLVFVDESGADRSSAARKYGWSPIGKQARVKELLARDQRYNFLPGYTSSGLMPCTRIYQGTTDAEFFEGWFNYCLLPLCNPFPMANSVIVMDNASFHGVEVLIEMAEQFDVRLEMLLPYSPDFNPIEELFGDIKKALKKHWGLFLADARKDFHAYLTFIVNKCGESVRKAKAHFRKSLWVEWQE